MYVHLQIDDMIKMREMMGAEKLTFNQTLHFMIEEQYRQWKDAKAKVDTLKVQ